MIDTNFLKCTRETIGLLLKHYIGNDGEVFA